eukprot:gene22117-biopygen22215
MRRLRRRWRKPNCTKLRTQISFECEGSHHQPPPPRQRRALRDPPARRRSEGAPAGGGGVPGRDPVVDGRSGPDLSKNITFGRIPGWAGARKKKIQTFQKSVAYRTGSGIQKGCGMVWYGGAKGCGMVWYGSATHWSHPPGENGSGRGPDAGRTIESKEADADRTRAH